MEKKNNPNLQAKEELHFSLAIDCSQLNKTNLALTDIVSNKTCFKSFETNNISTSLINGIQEVLASNCLNLEQIGRIIIASGPGSFTGIRNCFSTVLGLGFGLNIEVFSIANLMMESYPLRDKQSFEILKIANDKEYYKQEFQYSGSILKQFSEIEILNISSTEIKDKVILSDNTTAQNGLQMINDFFSKNRDLFKIAYSDVNNIGDLSVNYVKSVNAKTLVERGKNKTFL